jgi:serine/threonine protein kinase
VHNAEHDHSKSASRETNAFGDVRLTNRAHDLIADPMGPVPTPDYRSLASWYTPGLSDGLGDRLLMFDNTGASSLELLRFRREFATAPGFERALRERVAQLAPFKHPAFSEVRTVEYLDGDEGLALVSTHTSGKRLSDIFTGPQPHGAVHPAFAARLVHQLASALADLHAQHGVAHGALTADRIVLTPDGRVVIVEHVLGSALDQLVLPAYRLWEDLGIVAPPATNGIRWLDGRADVVQLGLVTLSILLGRRITPREYPQRLGLLLDEFAENAGRHSPSLVPQLRRWLERALQVHGGFGSALEAHDGLSQAGEAAGRHLLERGQLTLLPAMASIAEARMTDMALASNADSAPSDARDTQADDSPGASVQKFAAPDRLAHEEAVDTEDPTARLRLAMRRRRFSVPWNLAASFALLALVEGVGIGYLLTAGSRNPLATAKMPVTIESPTAGDLVMVDGRQVGVTPLELNVGSSMHSIRVLSREEARPSGSRDAASNGSAGVRARTDPRATESADARTKGKAPAVALVAVRPRSGGLRLISPIEIHVFEGERVLGSSADGPIVATAGVHNLDLVNSALGFRSRQTVEIKAGQIVPLTVRPPDGRVSINALPWAQVWIDGNPVGETPLANLTVPVGEHEITFRHPQLGERRETTVVQSGTLTRVSASLAR